MAIATGTALLIGAGVSAAANAYGAKKASDASKKAATVQSASADRAMNLQRDVYNQQMGLVRPYVDAGTQSLHAMMQRYGNAGMPMPNYGVKPPKDAGNAGAGEMGQPIGGPPMMGQGRPAASFGGARSMEMPGRQPPLSLADMRAHMQSQPRMVMVQSPDGETQPIPEHFLPQVLAAGGRRLS